MTQPLRGTSAEPGTGQARASLSREQAQFCVQFSTALSRARAYPPTHPLALAALDQLLRHLETLMVGRPAVVVRVTRDLLILDEAESDPGHPVMGELAGRLHRHQLAAVTFRQGIERAELADLLGAVAADTWKQGEPLGLEDQDQSEARWPRVQLEPLPLDQLELGDTSVPEGPASQRAARLWDGLVHAALSPGAAGDDGSPGEIDPATLATRIRARRGDADYARGVMEWMVQLAEHHGEGGTPLPVDARVAELFERLDQETLRDLLNAGATPAQRRILLHRGARALPVKAVLDLLRAATDAGSEEASPTLLRMLAKLAGHLEAGGGPTLPDAESVLRDSVRQLVGSWEGEAEQSPHRQMLELLARPVGSASPPSGRAIATPIRLVQLGLELGAETPAIAAAMRTVVEVMPLPELLGLVEQARSAGLDPARIGLLLQDPVYLRDQLVDEAVEFEVLDRLLANLGEAAVAPLLDAMELSESASRRKGILQRLEAIGSGLGPALVERLPEKPWFVQRNLLSLLASLEQRPAGFSAMPYARHENAKVRREALKLMFRDPVERPAAIQAGATDHDPGIVLLALAAASENLQPELVDRIPGLLESTYRAPQVRATAIRLLGGRPTRAGREWLLAQVVTRKGWLWFKRDALRPRTPEMLVALAVLARHFSGQPGVDRALRLARASGDAEIRGVVGGGSP